MSVLCQTPLVPFRYSWIRCFNFQKPYLLTPHQQTTLRLTEPTFPIWTENRKNLEIYVLQVQPVATDGPCVAINIPVPKTWAGAIWEVARMPPELPNGTGTKLSSLELGLILHLPLSSPSQSYCLFHLYFFLGTFLSKPLFYKFLSEGLLLGNPDLK